MASAPPAPYSRVAEEEVIYPGRLGNKGTMRFRRDSAEKRSSIAAYFLRTTTHKKEDHPKQANKRIMKRLEIAVFTVVLVVGLCQAGEHPLRNSRRCDSIENSKEELDCRKRRAAGLHCSDPSKCSLNSLTNLSLKVINVLDMSSTGHNMHVYYCDDASAARRIGMTCDSFPFYNGGYPFGKKLEWDDEWEIYTCNASGGTFCSAWLSAEDSASEYERGIYTCDEVGVMSDEPGAIEYCRKWSSEQMESKKCGAEYTCSPNCRGPTMCLRTCSDEYGSSYDCSYAPEVDYEYSIAECTQVHEEGGCLAWKQEEYDHHNVHFREYEEYKCLEISSNGRYCHRWVDEIDSEEEFEIATCQCMDDEISDNAYCHVWRCYEAGLSYYFPNYAWIVFPFCICALYMGILRGCRCQLPKNQCHWIIHGIVYFLFFFLSSIVMVRKSGLLGILVIVPVCLVILPWLFVKISNNINADTIQEYSTEVPPPCTEEAQPPPYNPGFQSNIPVVKAELISY